MVAGEKIHFQYVAQITTTSAFFIRRSKKRYKHLNLKNKLLRRFLAILQVSQVDGALRAQPHCAMPLYRRGVNNCASLIEACLPLKKVRDYKRLPQLIMPFFCN